MQETYLEFIAQHESIERAADHLLAEGRAVQPAELSLRLRTLAELVYHHVAAEDAVVLRMDQPKLPPALVWPWQKGKGDYLRLRKDWLLFLDQWTDAAVVADPDAFINAARKMMAQLKDALHTETRAFYAAALQGEAIMFGRPAMQGTA